MGYWTNALEGEEYNCVSIIQLERKGINKVRKCKLKK